MIIFFSELEKGVCNESRVFKHNKVLKELFMKVKNSVESSQSEDELIKALDPLVKFQKEGNPVKLKIPFFKYPMILSAITIVYLAVVLIGGYKRKSFIPEPEIAIWVFCGLFVALAIGMLMYTGASAELDELIKKKDVLFDNDMTENKIDGQAQWMNTHLNFLIFSEEMKVKL